MKKLTKQQIQCIADNNCLLMQQVKQQLTINQVRTLKVIVLSFIIGITLLSVFV